MAILFETPSTGALSFDNAVACSPLRQIPAFPGCEPRNGSTEQYYYEQDFIQRFTEWEPLPLNSLHPSNSSLYLVEEGQPQEYGAGLRRWTRVYAPIFQEYETEQMFAYTYAGTSYRDPQTVSVLSILRHKFFLVGVSVNDLDPSIPSKTSIALIDDKLKIPIFSPVPILDGFNRFSNTYANSFVVTLISGMVTLDEAAYMELAAEPLLRNRLMVAEPSVIQRWKGKLYERITRYVLAQYDGKT